MDVILHLGAHRTGSTSFQDYMTRSSCEGLAFWGPKATRGGILDGVQGSPLGMRPAQRAKGRRAVQFAVLEARGNQTLVISDENLIGPLRSNLRCATLYPEIGPRLARLYAAFGGQISKIGIQIRALDTYWTSVLAFGLSRGIGAPSDAMCNRIAWSKRSWRDVITEMACAMPDIPIVVTPFEQFVQRPDILAEILTGRAMPSLPAKGIWTNRQLSPAMLQTCLEEFGTGHSDQFFDAWGQWQPFSPDQRYRMHAQTRRDLDWLRSGADGLAQFHNCIPSERTVRARPMRRSRRGSEDNDSQERHLA